MTCHDYASSAAQQTLKVKNIPTAVAHTITRSDHSTVDARGLYTSLSAYEFGGQVLVKCERHQLSLASPTGSARPVSMRDASYNLHTIALGGATGTTYKVVIPVFGGSDLKLLVHGADCPPHGALAGTVPLPADAVVAQLTLSSEADGIMGAVIESFCAQRATESSAGAFKLFEDAPSSGGMKRIPSKDAMGG